MIHHAYVADPCCVASLCAERTLEYVANIVPKIRFDLWMRSISHQGPLSRSSPAAVL